MHLPVPPQLIFALLIEAALIFATWVFLVQPGPLLPVRSDVGKGALRVWGLVLLCITFCWSVVVGCIWAIQQITLRL